MSARLSQHVAAETVAEASNRFQPSSPSKNVHFSNLMQDSMDLVDDRARESASLLRQSKSRPQSTLPSPAMKQASSSDQPCRT